MAIPIGIYSATRQYSFTDFALTTLGFIGLATPNFLLALVLMFFFFSCCGVSIGGLFSLQYAAADWSLGKVWDLLKHLPTPIIVIGTAGTAGVIRVMRGSVLDELQRQYVITARAKGVGETALLFRYPVRVALNPIVSTIGWVLPAIVSGEAITAVVLSLPTTGPLLLNALLAQDIVPGRHHRRAAHRSDRHRHAALRHRAGDARPAHPLRTSPRHMTIRRGQTRSETAVDERYFVASQWRMMWRKLVRHRLAVVAAAVC